MGNLSDDAKPGVTSNLDRALEALGDSRVIRELHVTGSLDEAMKKIRASEIYAPRAEEQVEAVIRLAADARDLDGVYRLLHDAYAERGYIEVQPNRRCLYNAEFDNIPETAVLIAEAGGIQLGTVSLTLDSSRGLPVDRDFNAVCNLIRRKGRRKLACAWRLVTRHGHADERKVAMRLIGEVIRLAVERGVQTCLCAMSIKHQHFYRRLLNMKPLAHCRAMRGLQNTSGVCMRADIETLLDWWKR